MISPDDAPTKAELEAIVGEGITLTLDRLKTHRLKSVAFHVAGHALRTRFRDEEGNLRPYLFPQLLHVATLDRRVPRVARATPFPQYLLWKPLAEKAVDRIYRACAQAEVGEERLRPILDAYNREGSGRFVDFRTTRETLWKTDREKCQINFVVFDSEWEVGFAKAIEAMPEVRAYVKNHNLGFEVPYVEGGRSGATGPTLSSSWTTTAQTDRSISWLRSRAIATATPRPRPTPCRGFGSLPSTTTAPSADGAFLELRDKYDVRRR